MLIGTAKRSQEPPSQKKHEDPWKERASRRDAEGAATHRMEGGWQ